MRGRDQTPSACHRRLPSASAYSGLHCIASLHKHRHIRRRARDSQSASRSVLIIAGSPPSTSLRIVGYKRQPSLHGLCSCPSPSSSTSLRCEYPLQSLDALAGAAVVPTSKVLGTLAPCGWAGVSLHCVVPVPSGGETLSKPVPDFVISIAIRGVFQKLTTSSLPFLWPIVVPYTIWALFIDDAQFNGGRPRESARRFFLWKYFGRESACMWLC